MVRKIVLTLVWVMYGALAFFVYIGFLLSESKVPKIFRYSIAHFVLLIFLILVLCLPPLLVYLRRKYGGKILTYSLIPSLVLLLFVYIGFSTYYYYTITHVFDPFLQAPPPPIERAQLDRVGDSYRILAIGGSTTRNGHLRKEDRYPALLESIINDRHPGREVDVFNSGQDWWTSKHSLINYVTNVCDWRPDLVVVMHAVNDLYRSFAPKYYSVGEYDPSWSHFYGPAIGGADPPSYPGHLYRRYIRRLLWKWYPRQRFVEVDYPLERYVSLPQFEINLKRLIHYLRSDGVEILLLTQPSILKDEMTKAEWNVLKIGFGFCISRRNFWQSEYPSPRSLSAAMNAFNDVTRRVAAEEGIPLVDLAEIVPRELDNFVDDVHYTPQGSRLVGEVIAAAIDSLGLLDQSDITGR
jgi:lysophospholipase L1-like esterase